MRISVTRTLIFVVVNDWVFWVSFLEMPLEYFVSCFCLFASVTAFWYAGQPLHTIACEPPQFAHFACSFDSLQLFTVCLPAHRRYLNSSLQSLAEWPNFWHLKHCLMWCCFLLGSQRQSTQPILTPCLIAAVTWFEQSVITRISFVGFPVALLFIRSTLITFIALLFRSSSFNSFSCMLWWTFTITKLGLVLAFGRVFRALTEVLGKTSCRFEAFIRHSHELWSSGWIMKSLLLGSSLMQLILSWGKLLLIERAKWTCVGLGFIVLVTGLIVSELVFGKARAPLRLFLTWTKSCSSCDVSSALFRASERSALN